MFCVSPKLYPKRAAELLFVAFVVVIFLTFGSITSRAQRQRAQDEDQPLFVEFKGVHIGMPAEEARKKLGSPRDKSDEQDFYLFNENQAVQIFYDKGKTVSAISIDFMSGAANIPEPKAVIGGEPDKKPDGSSYKMVRYTKAGYWVSYSKTAGTSPTITITMQKIEH